MITSAVEMCLSWAGIVLRCTCTKCGSRSPRVRGEESCTPLPSTASPPTHHHPHHHHHHHHHHNHHLPFPSSALTTAPPTPKSPSRDVGPASSCRRRLASPGHLLEVILSLMAIMASTTAAYDLKPTTTVSRVVLAGLTARLPCELPLPQDRPTLILWYKGQVTRPFYSYDARENDAGHHKVHEGSLLGKRSRFQLETFRNSYQSKVGFLEVESISLADAGNYTCRVDFMTSQTMMSLLQLTVHEDIRGLEIFDAYEAMIGRVAGPYELSTRVLLSCRAYGGHPTPLVEWRSREGLLLEGSQSRPAGGGRPPARSVGVTLHLPGLRREDSGREVTCVASSTNLTRPHSRTVTIHMYLPPLEVRLEGLEEPLRAGAEAALACRSKGSKPPAALAWSLPNSTALAPFPAQSSLDQNTTVGRAGLLPTSADHGRTLTCTATNPQVPRYSLAATHKLDVLFPPEARADLAPALDPENIKEGEDVYFECHIRANPPESRVTWLHQGKAMQTDKERGVLAQGRNLVLQGVKRDARGKYQCKVTNSIATVTSLPASLDILFVPECRDPKNTTVPSTEAKEVELECSVESNPPEVHFLWRVNGSRGLQEADASSHSSRGQTSTFLYSPEDGDQAGLVFCLASNRLGTQREPCLFTITPAGPPKEPASCSLVNQSATSLGVTCVPGHDGGLSQTFIATVQDAGSQEVVASVSSAAPSFTVDGLASGRDYLVLVSAANAHGESDPYVLHGFALKVAENKIDKSSVAGSSSSSSSPSSLLAVFVGAVCGFGLVLAALALAARSRSRRRREGPDAVAAEDATDEELPNKSSTGDSEEEVKAPESHSEVHGTQAAHTHLLEIPPTPISPQSMYYPFASAHSSSRPQEELSPRPQPLHSVDLAQITSNEHKYYTLKINCTRRSNESFV